MRDVTTHKTQVGFYVTDRLMIWIIKKEGNIQLIAPSVCSAHVYYQYYYHLFYYNIV